MKGAKFMGSLATVMMALTAGSCAAPKTRQTANELEPIPGGGNVWSDEIDAQAKSLISPPEKIPALSRFLLGCAEREFDKELLPGRVLTWSTDLGIASGALELYIEKGSARILDPRMVYILRMQVSYAASSPFAIDVNAYAYKEHSISDQEIRAMQGLEEIDSVDSFSEKEKTALRYAVAMTRTPVAFDERLLSDVRRLFSHEEIVAIAALSAKVNYWARFIEALRIEPAGYSDDPLLRLDEYRTFKTFD